jgi:hypothetical protein
VRWGLLVPVLVLAGCGTQERSPALAPVRLTITAPSDLATVEDDVVEVAGEVVPRNARVRVAGAEAEVRGGAFSATVALEAGANVIDVQAAAPRHPAAMAAVRVTRLVPVEVPDLEDLAPEEAVAALEAIGLEAEVRDGGGLLDGLLPDDPTVCGTSPEAGEQVRVGTRVVVVIARGC